MAYSDHLADRVRARLSHLPGVQEKSMMGGLVFLLGGKMCLGVDIDKRTGWDRLMVRVGKLPYESLLKRPGSRPMDFTGRVMRGFLFIDPSGFDAEEDLDFWTEKALEFNKMLRSGQMTND